MNFLGRKIRPQKTAPNKAQRIIHREIEITVEREWISEIWRVPAEGTSAKLFEGQPADEQMTPELLLPKPTDG